MKNENPSQVRFLRHVVATIAYRGGKSIREAPSGYGDFEIAPGSRTPVQMLSHIGDVLSWAVSVVDAEQAWRGPTPESWESEVERFFGLLEDLDSALVAASRDELPALQLLQGPLADTLTHIGQLALLRRLVGAPVRGENYFKADIVEGRVGPEQTRSENEFD